MSDGKLTWLLTRLRRSAVEAEDGISDAQLLERFAARSDEAAFELLVWRHQRLVFGICRRVLHDVHAAEDAFQATFLALARKAGSITKREALASWLFKVAYRVSLTAKAGMARRASRECTLGETAKSAEARLEPAPELKDHWAIVTEEVSRLPERFRAPTVLCYFEGKTVDEAARQLGCPRGTVASRLVRARARLRSRLARRGLALTAGAVAAVFSEARAPASISSTLVRAAVRAGGLSAANHGAAGPEIPIQVAALTEEVLKAMFIKKMMTVVALLIILASVLLLGGGVAIAIAANSHAAPASAAAPEDEPKQAEDNQAHAQEPRPAPAPNVVTVSRPTQRELAPFEDFTGRLEWAQLVTIAARVAGRLKSVHVVTPQVLEAAVKEGDLLFEIDPVSFEQQVAKATAQLADAEALYKHLAARAATAKQDFAAGSMSKQGFEKIAQESARAEAASVTAKRALEIARQNLQATRMVAPFDGKLGAHGSKPGDMIAGSWEQPATLARLVCSEHSIGVHFDIDERSYLRCQRLLRARQLQGVGDPIRVALADETDFPHAGILTSFEDRVNEASGTVRAHGILRNPDGLMLPGMFARVRMFLGKPRPVLMVPEGVIDMDQSRYVLVVNERNIVERRDVKLGQMEGNMRVIQGGLRSDDWVITGGAKDLSPGAQVEPRREPTKRPERR